MRLIPLTKERFSIVDDDDFDWLSQHEWQLCDQPWNEYALRKEWESHTIGHSRRMHREILAKHGVDIIGKEIDHINGDGLDNRKKNLRTCNRSSNSANRGKNANNSSGYKGVTWDRQANQWRAKIQVRGRHLHLGRFSSKEAAALAYNNAAKEHFGQFAYFNQI